MAIASLVLGGCGLAESIAEGFVDDQNITLPLRTDRSGTVIRDNTGADVEVRPSTFVAGDTDADDTAFGVLGFAIDRSRQPDKTELDRIVLRVWVEPAAGDAAPMGPLVVSHLPAHPDAPLATGVVPNPPGSDITVIEDVTAVGWREVDVTSFFKQDWEGGRLLSAFSLRLVTGTDNDGQEDTVLLEDSTAQARAELVLTFSLSL